MREVFSKIPEGTTHVSRFSTRTTAGGVLDIITMAFKYKDDVLYVFETDNDNEYPDWTKAERKFHHLNFPLFELDAKDKEIETLRAQLKVAQTELAAYKHDVSIMFNELKQYKQDVERLECIEEMALESRTGITVQFVKVPAEGIEPSWKGYRLITFHNGRQPFKSLREAIDAAMKGE